MTAPHNTRTPLLDNHLAAASPATIWAWKNLPIRQSPTVKVVFLAAAGLADQALHDPNGYTSTLVPSLAELTGIDPYATREACELLVAKGLLVRKGQGYRVSERAFGGSDHHSEYDHPWLEDPKGGCATCNATTQRAITGGGAQ